MYKENYAVVSASKQAASAAIAVLVGMTMDIANAARSIRQNAAKYFRRSLVLSF